MNPFVGKVIAIPYGDGTYIMGVILREYEDMDIGKAFMVRMTHYWGEHVTQPISRKIVLKYLVGE